MYINELQIQHFGRGGGGFIIPWERNLSRNSVLLHLADLGVLAEEAIDKVLKVKGKKTSQTSRGKVHRGRENVRANVIFKCGRNALRGDVALHKERKAEAEFVVTFFRELRSNEARSHVSDTHVKGRKLST